MSEREQVGLTLAGAGDGAGAGAGGAAAAGCFVLGEGRRCCSQRCRRLPPPVGVVLGDAAAAVDVAAGDSLESTTMRRVMRQRQTKKAGKKLCGAPIFVDLV